MFPGRYLLLSELVRLNISVSSATSKGSLGQISTFLLLELAYLVLHICIEIQAPIRSRTWHFTIRTMSFVKGDSTSFLTPFPDPGIDQTHATPNLAHLEQLPNKGSTKTTICSQQSFFLFIENALSHSSHIFYFLICLFISSLPSLYVYFMSSSFTSALPFHLVHTSLWTC
jgi:hypothetical protein